ncbi:MAG: hypothetical protein NTV21_04515 [Planctomycetota bacterium]|nr:hypothetical protein [Planctomycetota bacterium]
MLPFPDVGPHRMSGGELTRLFIVLALLASFALVVVLAIARRLARKRDGQ